MSRAVLIGQSHVEAVVEALSGEPETEELSVYRLKDRRVGTRAKTATLTEAMALVASLPAHVPVFLSILGSYHNHLGLLRAGQPFDFLLGADDEPDPKAAARIPHRALAGVFQSIFAESASIRKIRGAANSPVYLMSAPPPKHSNPFLLGVLMRQGKRTQNGLWIEEAGVERPESRRKLWQLEARMIAEWAKAQDMGFVPAPAEAISAGGYLARKFYGTDATHANGKYGALVIDQINSIVERRTEEAAHG